MNLFSALHYPVFGGPHSQALRLAAPLGRLGVRTVVLLPDEPGNAAGRLRARRLRPGGSFLERLLRSQESLP